MSWSYGSIATGLPKFNAGRKKKGACVASLRAMMN